jgi:hypothetical protein
MREMSRVYVSLVVMMSCAASGPASSQTNPAARRTSFVVRSGPVRDMPEPGLDSARST